MSHKVMKCALITFTLNTQARIANSTIITQTTIHEIPASAAANFVSSTRSNITVVLNAKATTDERLMLTKRTSINFHCDKTTTLLLIFRLPSP